MEVQREYDFGGKVDWRSIAERMGEEALRKRISKQNLHYTSISVRQRRFIAKELIKYAAEWCFRVTGLFTKGHHHFCDIQLVENSVMIQDLPAELKGLRILQISDLHLDLHPDLTDFIVKRVKEAKYDVAVVTGDFRNLSHGDFSLCMECTQAVVEALNGPVYAILGNHDYLEMAVSLEAMGVNALLNESVALKFGGSEYWLTGIDDPHYYQTDDLKHSLKSVPEKAFKILLSHSPETYKEASAYGFQFFLCGHTHGGQICLPGGIPIIIRSKSPRWCARGNWQWQGMQGFTTTGTGGCGAALRLHCPPEIVVHTLEGSESSD